MPIFPLLAGPLYLLLRGRRGVLPTLALVAGYRYAIGYTALNALAGIPAGVVVQTQGRAPLCARSLCSPRALWCARRSHLARGVVGTPPGVDQPPMASADGSP